MELLPIIITIISVIIILILWAKIYFLHKAADEISKAVTDRLSEDTNTLIDISTRDRHMRKLASELNVQLRLLRRERHRYGQGDLELKEAVTNISHDLRTPITAISGYLDLLEREKFNERADMYIMQIRERTEALKGLTEELFRYSMVLSTKELKCERVDLVQRLEESLLSFYSILTENGITPDIRLPDRPVFRFLDPSALSRMFSNLISNAVKYSDGDIAVVMTDDGCITFSNTAKNIDAVTVGRLFDRFYTVEVGKNSTGLGLSIAKVLTERMGGSIEAEYSHGKLIIKIVFKENSNVQPIK